MENQISDSSIKNVKRPSIQRHDRQKLWQILIPIIFVVLLILAVGVLIVLTATRPTGGGTVSQWADVSTIWIVLPLMAFAFMGLLITAGIIYLLSKILNILPVYGNLVQQYAGLMAARANLITRKIVAPIVSARSTRAGVGGFFRSLFRFARK
jgi:hypothetical protein